MRPRLVIFAKAPVIGGAKSRLARGVGRVAAWRLYRAMTARVIRSTRDARWDTVLAVSPDRAAARRFSVWPEALARLPQGRGDLGARQERVFRRRVILPRSRGRWPEGPEGGDDLSNPDGVRFCEYGPSAPPSVSFADTSPVNGGGHRRGPVCLIGTDAPQVRRGDVARAFAALKRHDAVIGPAEDGGYWLLALNAPAPRGLFEGVRWSHAGTREDLIGRLRSRGLGRIAMLRTLRDIDEAGDLQPLSPRFSPAG